MLVQTQSSCQLGQNSESFGWSEPELQTPGSQTGDGDCGTDKLPTVRPQNIISATSLLTRITRTDSYIRIARVSQNIQFNTQINNRITFHSIVIFCVFVCVSFYFMYLERNMAQDEVSTSDKVHMKQLKQLRFPAWTELHSQSKLITKQSFSNTKCN